MRRDCVLNSCAFEVEVYDSTRNRPQLSMIRHVILGALPIAGEREITVFTPWVYLSSSFPWAKVWRETSENMLLDIC